MSPTLLIVLYLTFMPRTVSFVAVSDVAKAKTFAPAKVELGYFVASSNEV